MRKAFLVYFPKSESRTNPYSGNYDPASIPDERPVLIIANDIADVATKNRNATRIEEVNCRDVLIDERIKETFCPMQENKP